MEIEPPIDWQKRRREILARLEEEEKTRVARIEKARRLSRGWELIRICREIIKENAKGWEDRKEWAEAEEVLRKRREQVDKANYKKRKFKEKQQVKDRERKITEMMEKIPIVEAEKIEREVRKEEKLEMAEIGKNLWKKWRGKTEFLKRKCTIPKEEDKITRRLDEIERKIEEYKKRKEEQLKKKHAKKEEWKRKNKMIVEDHWGMLRWLHQYTEENKMEWERRRSGEKEE